MALGLRVVKGRWVTDQSRRPWLQRAQLAVSEVRSFRDEDMLRFWPGVLRRLVVALSFAVVSAAAAGAGYGWVTAAGHERTV